MWLFFVALYSCTLHFLFYSPAAGASASLRILVHNRHNTAEDVYIQQMHIDGVSHECAFVTHNTVMKGGVWEYFMGSAPNKLWGAKGRKCII